MLAIWISFIFLEIIWFLGRHNNRKEYHVQSRALGRALAGVYEVMNKRASTSFSLRQNFTFHSCKYYFMKHKAYLEGLSFS